MLNREVFFARVRASLFAGHLDPDQVAGLTFLLESWDRTGFADLRHLAYALATTFHETGRAMQPVREVGQGRGRAYGVPAGPWHNVYYGRGDVQDTWEANYVKAGRLLAAHGIVVDLDRDPDKMLDPTIAALILFYGMAVGQFTGKKLSDYFAGTHADPVNARRIINALDCAHLISGYYAAFLAALSAASVATPSAAA